MPFRDDGHAANIVMPADPFARFTELHAAFAEKRAWLEARDALHFAAINLVTTPGEPAALAAATRARDAAIAAKAGWYTSIEPSIRMVIAAHVVKHGEDVRRLMLEVGWVRGMFRTTSVRRGGIHEVIAVLALRRVLGGAAIEQHHVTRFKQIYEAMKRHHWWLTGPEDYPACALLVGRPGEPADIGASCDAIYQALRAHARPRPGDALQTAANVLSLHGAGADELAERFGQLIQAFHGEAVSIGQEEFDEIAVLCFLARPVERIVASVLDLRERVRAALPALGPAAAFCVGVDLAFVGLVHADRELDVLADTKLLLDMNTISLRDLGSRRIVDDR